MSAGSGGASEAAPHVRCPSASGVRAQEKDAIVTNNRDPDDGVAGFQSSLSATAGDGAELIGLREEVEFMRPVS